MAVVSVQPFGEVQCTWSLARLRRQYVQTWQVLTDSVYDGPAIVMLSSGLPRPGATYVFGNDLDLAAICTEVSPSRPDPQECPLLWRVRLTYETVSANPSQQSSGGNPEQDRAESPLSRPAVPSWGWTSGSKPFTRTAESSPRDVQAANKEAFDPPPEIDDPCQVLTVVRNEATFDPSTASYYMNTINQDSFQGYSQYQARIVEFSGQKQFEKNLPFWQVTYRFAFKTPDWDLEVRNKGTYYLTGNAADQKQRDPDVAGNHMPFVDLDAFGRKLIGNTPVYLKFRRYFPVTFAALRIPYFGP